ncbi:Uncharacterized membrane protein YheB, UPF0754 family [Salinibacillus kushneri]|uniref:Uncharacterized membrane protein YheB, UPF0754 family n=1 Tax=Salinibacillus kushneri TaxID=237682 RepID=A0A1I0AWD9_9BACI|nr:DUF445 family protein [Salinibacillus kushneri]SES98298.1 Uncharacterized membrane protein YheB, UPF0754 family [Salinibacillus kushneri]
MDIFFTFLFMIIIGAAIGGMTNSLAIKMLFRPYAPKYIGNIKIPFTPGLIPKRQSELARQMGNTVVKHLLTPEGMKKKFQNQYFYNQVVTWLKKEVERFAKRNMTVQDLLIQLNIHLSEKELKKISAAFIEKQINQWLLTNKRHTLRSLLPSEVAEKSQEYIPEFTSYILGKADQYVRSEAGKQKIGSLAEGYLGGSGFFGNMISSFLGGDGLADRIQPAISQYLQSDDARFMVKGLIEQEWEKLQDREIHEIESMLLSNRIKTRVASKIANIIPYHHLLQTPVKTLFIQYQSVINDQLIPHFVTMLQAYLVKNIQLLMNRLNLEELVKDQVENFEVQRLETMVLGISRRELKMITYLGALLGGFIGLIQAIIVLILT